MPMPDRKAIWCAFCRSLCVATVIIWPTFRAAIRLINEVLFFIAQTMAREMVCCPERNAKYFIDSKGKVGLTTRMSTTNAYLYAAIIFVAFWVFCAVNHL